MKISAAKHREIAAQHRRYGFDFLAVVHELEAIRLERAPFEVQTVYDLPTGDQVDVSVGFDVEPGEREPYGPGSQDTPPAVVVVWIQQPNGTKVDFDALTPDQQQQIIRACEGELEARNR